MEQTQSSKCAGRLLAIGVCLVLLVILGVATWLNPMKVVGMFLFGMLSAFPFSLFVVPGLWVRLGEQPPPMEFDLRRRRLVWGLLSDLYLDTELMDEDLAAMAEGLAKSGYSIHQLDEILFRELHPVLIGNLIGGFGEWAGFDLDWLQEKILASRRRSWPVGLVFGRSIIWWQWRRVRRHMAAISPVRV